MVAKVGPARLAEWGQSRGWERLRLLSSAKNSYNADYHGETPDGRQLPACNVFTRDEAGVIRHFYSTELLYTPLNGQPRHIDLLWPIWSLFDLTPEGRGENWYPKLAYE